MTFASTGLRSALGVLACAALATAQSEFFFRLDNYGIIYYNGGLVYVDEDWNIADGTIIFESEPQDGDVIAIKGVDSTYYENGAGGIIAWISGTDIYTSAEDWKCISAANFEPSDACASPEAIACDTSSWPAAVEEDDDNHPYRGAKRRAQRPLTPGSAIE